MLKRPSCICIRGALRAGPTSATKGFRCIITCRSCTALGRPDLELDPRNLLVLCETEHNDPEANHHLLLGHLGNFKSDNVHVAEDIALFAGMDAAAIQADPRWLARKAARLKPLHEMTDQDKADFRALMDAMFPAAALVA